jgi:transposase
MAARARDRRSSNGIDGPILETSVGSAGKVPETDMRDEKAQGGSPGTLHLAQALSNRGRRGRKRDFPDAERLVKRLVAQELTLSFVPDAEQRLWRTVTRKKYQLRCDRIRLQNQLESLLEEAHIKLSSLVSDLLGLSARRMLKAIAEGETSPATLAALADERLRATPEQLCDALGACTELNAVYRRLLKMALEELRLIDEQIGRLDQEMASLLSEHQDAVQRLAEVPGLGVDSAQQIIAEVGPTAATFPSEKCLSSWVGACPGDEESARVNYSHRSPKGNRHMRRLLNQAANAAARTKGSIFEIVYRRSVRAWDTIKPSGPSPIDRSCTKESVTRNVAQRSPNDRSNCALGR